MATLLVASTRPLSGKTALCAALGSRFLSDGLKVGYLKPLSPDVRRVNGKAIDEDAQFMKGLLHQPEPAEGLSPVAFTPLEMESIIGGQGRGFQESVREALARVAKGRDVVLLEGAGRAEEGTLAGLSASEVASLCGAKVLVVARYDGPRTADDILAASRALSTSLLGVVINMVPPDGLDFVEKSLASFLQGKGVHVLGAFPQSTALLAVTVGELAEYLGGEFLNCEDRKDELVENLLLGALSTDFMFDYYTRRKDIALITSGEKTDIQLFGMGPSTKCMVLTGYRRPTELVLAQAVDNGIPLILVKEDTLTVAEKVEGLPGRMPFRQGRKLACLQEIMEERFDFTALYQGLGLAARG